MGKRSNFDRIPRDFYPTPSKAVEPLLPHLPKQFTYWEPCAGDGALIDALPGECVAATDIEPRGAYMYRFDALDASTPKFNCDLIITNPPWDRKILHPMIEKFCRIAPTWLLFDADWVHTQQSALFASRLRKIVSVGRVKWIPDSKMTGKDNCAWHLFDAFASGPTEFVGRTGKE